MKEDVLEQLVDDYLRARGYFTRHNLKFRPRNDHQDFVLNQDSNHSDIDVLGYHPLRSGPERIMAVSCKSWQSGFKIRSIITALEGNRIRSGREAWKAFRELTQPKWSEAFIETVHSVTGSAEFTYVTAVTAVKGERAIWENYPRFKEAMRGNPVRLLSLEEMLVEMVPVLSTTVAASQFGRTLQLLKAAGYSFTAADIKAVVESADS
ncbi:MAG: hypothetical protein LC795_06410 [Acidobacteria bacterium]|nr:hypothetical protein [Acidobacteriota bacterium]